MPEIVLKCVRVVVRKREAGGRCTRTPGSLSWSWPGQCPDLSRGELGFMLQTFIWLSKIETVFDGGGE